ncbi:hypothetical protein JW964_26070, partial [candidate division KSB1 bacterium]|nr:hypothetical protein [candidate division KSB1 bacterium]
MKNIVLILLFLINYGVSAQQFEIRGVLPWHNFLAGPTAWNEKDYAQYLDECQQKGINFIAFHNYTGGNERYASYVEPMIKIQYKNILPEAGFDHSGTARWGYLPMKVSEFAFGSNKLFSLPRGAEYFGAENAILARTNEERYANAQKLMQKVLMMAQERGIQMAMGFEFGVAPPEFASIHTHSDMYWTGNASMVYNPFDPDVAGILYATIDNILETYPGLDYIYLWLNEHCMFGVNPDEALKNPKMAAFFDENEKYYSGEKITRSLKLLGVWTQAYIRMAYHYIQLKSPITKIAIGGWGGEDQMALLLSGLNQTLPEDITFSMLNPDLGYKPHPDFFKEIARERSFWAIPWLEGDNSLWHLQPRVNDMIHQVRKAFEDKLSGVIAIHWRTQEIKDNFDAFALLARNPELSLTAAEFYQDQFLKRYGEATADKLAPIMTHCDINATFKGIVSTEFWAYNPSWGRLNKEQADSCLWIISVIEECSKIEKESGKLKELEWLKNSFRSILLLDQVSRYIEPA